MNTHCVAPVARQNSMCLMTPSSADNSNTMKEAAIALIYFTAAKTARSHEDNTACRHSATTTLLTTVVLFSVVSVCDIFVCLSVNAITREPLARDSIAKFSGHHPCGQKDLSSKMAIIPVGVRGTAGDLTPVYSIV